ncbi:MAG: permease [Candidatus Omnitrophica bacterium]|nr:permease [Candidatus Omnitrophota bacterium]
MQKRRKSEMLVPTIILGVIAIGVSIVAYQKNQHIEGMKSAFSMTVEILPIVLLAFITAAMVQVIIPKELIAKWVGQESGIKGIFVGSLAGALTPGGPYVSFPIAAGLMRSGASIGTMVAFVSGWALWGISRLPLEIGILGWKFALIRFFSVCLVPPIAGLVANFLFKVIK